MSSWRPLSQDITGGLEKVPIPAFNEVDDEPFPTFTYIPVCCWSDEAAAMLRQLKPYVGSRGTCARGEGRAGHGVKWPVGVVRWAEVGLVRKFRTLKYVNI